VRAEAILYVVDRLVDATEGVNAQLAAVPKETGWTVPADVTIADAVTYPWVARGVFDRSQIGNGPWLLVGASGDIFADGTADANGRATVDVVIRYGAAGTDTETLADLTRASSLTLRAAMRAVLLPWHQNPNHFVTRNEVEFEAPSVRWLDPTESVGDDVLSSALVVSFPCLDPWALGN
jgi:hypothetical protein